MAKQTIDVPPEVGSAVTAISGMETLGKTAVSLLFILALILALSYLLRKLNRGAGHNHHLLRQVASASLGTRERVVVMEVNDTWLVLGVSSGRINKLHECPVPENDSPAPAGSSGEPGFAQRLALLMNPDSSQRQSKT